MPSFIEKRIDQSPSPVFYKKVWKAMLRIPKGKVTTYGELARRVGNKKASRAVGKACNRNIFAPEVPCHRVIAGSGKLGGFASGLENKKKLLRKEKVVWDANEKIDLDVFGFF
jgi:methylated-DNA-[protein]-cysteine S-methyltransferase